MEDTIKEERAKAKRRVTKSIRKLKSALMLGATSEILSKESLELENSFDNLNELHLDYEETTGIEDSEYLASITEEFNSTMKLYYISLKEEENIRIKREIAPLLTSIERGFNKMELGLKRLDEVDATNLKIDVVETDKNCFDKDTKELLSNIERVSSSIDTTEMGAKVNKILADYDSVGRTINNLLRETKQQLAKEVSITTDTQDTISEANVPCKITTQYATACSIEEQNVSSEDLCLKSKGKSGLTVNQEHKLEHKLDTDHLSNISDVSDIKPTNAQNDRIDTGNINMNSTRISTPEKVFKDNGHQIKKIELPDFFGSRKQWPEFKAIFKHLAEASYQSEQALAYELKRHVRAPADSLIQAVYSTRPGAYEKMWKKLGEVYDDPGASVTAALSTLHSLRKPYEDFKSIVNFINEVEAVHAQLEELEQLNCVTVRDIDTINNLLPMAIKMEWNRKYNVLDSKHKLQPFSKYMEFLEIERAAMIRTSDHITVNRNKRLTMLGSSDVSYSCYVHKSMGHSTLSCRSFARMSVQDKFDLCRKEKLCFKCILKHKKDECLEGPCQNCGKSHNPIMCPRNPLGQYSDSHQFSHNNGEVQTEHIQTNGLACSSLVNHMAVLPLAKVQVQGYTKYPALALFDSGSDASYITFQFANRMGIRPIRKLRLHVTTMGNVATSIPTSVFQIPLINTDGNIILIEVFGIKEITGQVTRLDEKVIKQLFPHQDATGLQRHKSEVDILLGCDNFGLHPKREIARAGENLSIMSGKLGLCLQGAHERLREETKLSSYLVKTIHGEDLQLQTYFTQSKIHPLFLGDHVKQIHTSTLIANSKTENFIIGEELGTAIQPKCGSCRCGKCPLPGHTYSFIEQQELQMIQDGLHHDKDNKRWITKYPWLVNPSVLPQNYAIAETRLKRLEKSLEKDHEWAKSYQAQLQDMIDRGVSKKLTLKDMQEWKGPAFYISHLAVTSPKSASTPIRIVFNSSQTQNGISLNSCLAKGPDSYTNNMLGLLLRWRENHIAMVADIRKMFHSIFLEELEMHCHRYLWRDMDKSKEPSVYAIQRVNMGDRPASAIATEALKMTAVLQQNEHPEAAQLIIHSSYMDDLIDSVKDKEEAIILANKVDTVLKNGGFFIKCWQFSYSSSALDSTGKMEIESQLKSASEKETAVLGVNWIPEEDKIIVHSSIKFSKKKNEINQQSKVEIKDIDRMIPQNFSRREVLKQVMTIYDPLGIMAPFILKAKILLRKTWELKLGWDEDLPNELKMQWVLFFQNLQKMDGMKFNRSLTPSGAVGKPWLILFSDGSELAYGFVAYIRWRLEDGSYWSRLIMAKSRIAPLHKTTTPRMELNAAVLSARGRKVIETEMRLKFEKTIHLIDSFTVLKMLHKTSTRFQIYEGSRVGEIQAATNGDLSEWAWLPGGSNIADHITRGLEPDNLSQESKWWTGPPMLYQDFKDWNIKYGGETNQSKCQTEQISLTTQITSNDKISIINLERFSKISKLKLVLARIFGIFKAKSFKGGRTNDLCPSLVQLASKFLIKNAQESLYENQKRDNKESKSNKVLDCYKSLNPKTNHEGILTVGSRMSRYNPMTLDGKCQILLPTNHPFTKLSMLEAHERGHLGRDGTLLKFREHFWTPHGDKLAKSVKARCQECRLRDAKLTEQCMGQYPRERLHPSPPFNATMLDYLGPFWTRGEVQKRTSGKCYFVLFTDITSRAVHIECTFGYDIEHFMMALSRFVHIRGWPEYIYSDPGSQLIGAEKDLRQHWNKQEKENLIKKECHCWN